jgi:hypothetical protein
MQKTVDKLIVGILDLDLKMAAVKKVTGQSQIIIFQKHYSFNVLFKVYDQLNKESDVKRARILIPCLTVKLANCTVRIYRTFTGVERKQFT